MLVAGLFFALMGVCVKLGAEKFSAAELVFYRSLFGLLFILIVTFITQKPLKTPYLKAQLGRAITGFISLVMFFYAISQLPLATAITLNYTSPIFLALLSPLLLKPPTKKHLYLPIVVGFVGVYFLLKPTFNSAHWLAGLIGLFSGVGAGLAYIQVAQLGKLGEPDWRTVFYFTLLCTVGAGLWMLLVHFHPVTWQDIPLLLAMGISATIAQLAMTRAYRTGNHLVVGSLAYSTVVLSSLFGIFIWHETLSAQNWLAIAVIIASGVASVLLRAK